MHQKCSFKKNQNNWRILAQTVCLSTVSFSILKKMCEETNRAVYRCSRDYIDPNTPKFIGAKRYVKEGLSKDDMSYVWKTKAYDGKIKGPVWDDTIIKTDKKGKPVLNHSYDEEFKSKEIVDADRFRDALVSTDCWEEGYGLESFYHAFDETWHWTDEYKRQSKKIFDFVVQGADQCVFAKCEGAHNFVTPPQGNSDSDGSSDADSSDSDKSAGFAICETAHYELALMRYHIENCTGDQSDKLWRSKVFQILNEEFEKLPKKNNGAKRTMSQKWQMDMLHTVIVVLATVNEWNDFIYNRLYDPADFQPLVNISDRVSAVMKNLIFSETFNSQQMSKVLAFLTATMESVAKTFHSRIPNDFWDGEKPALFGGSRANGALSTCQKLVKTYAEKFTENASPPPQVAPSQADTEPNTVHLSDETEKTAVPKSNKRTFSDAVPQSKKMKCCFQ